MSQDVVNAITDLTRVILAVQGKYESKAEAVRGLSALSIPPPRIAAILAMELNQVHKELSRARKQPGPR